MKRSSAIRLTGTALLMMLAGAALGVFGCGVEFQDAQCEDPNDAGASEVSQAVRAAFARSCVSCHGGSGGTTGLALNESDLSRLAGRDAMQSDLPLVVFGEPQRSYLALKMMPGALITGLPMPPVANDAGNADRQTILAWISDANAAPKPCNDGIATDDASNSGGLIPRQDCVLDAQPLFGEPWSAKDHIAPIFAARCSGSGCHTGGGMVPPVLDRGSLRDALVSVTSSTGAAATYVTPFDATRSYLWRKLTDTHLTIDGGNGLAMPVGQPLCDDDLAAIYGWIVSGANP